MESRTFQMEITQCRECPNCQLRREPDPTDWFCDDDEGAYCKAVLENDIPKKIEGMLRPYEKIFIPDWCPLNVDIK